jgi:hypothetical protein
MNEAKRSAFKFKSTTNEGLPAKFTVKLYKDDKINGLLIRKQLFTTDKDYFAVKRKWKGVYYSVEMLSIKTESLFTIANEVFKFNNDLLKEN